MIGPLPQVRRKSQFHLTDASRFILTLLTRVPEWAAAGAKAQIDYIGVDIERIGKADRQAKIKEARINDHGLEHLPSLRAAGSDIMLFARLNPLRTGSAEEIEHALALGAQVLMLPQFKCGAEVAEFCSLVAGRARVVPLLEDVAALDDLDAVLAACRDGEIMVGLNDLARSLGLAHPLCLANSQILEEFGSAARAHGVLWGFGGITSPEPRPDLPIQPDDLLSRYADLGAQAAWISRTMIGSCTPAEFPERVNRIRTRLEYWRTAGRPALAAAKSRLDLQIKALVKSC